MVIRNNNLREAVVHDMVTLSREQRYNGVRLVASVAHDAADCQELLDALGLDPADGRSPAEDDQPEPPPVLEDRPDRGRHVDRHDPRSFLDRRAAGRPGLTST
jgi:hypothetical protein